MPWKEPNRPVILRLLSSSAAFLLPFTLLGCARTPLPTVTPTSTTPQSLAGNWQMEVQSPTGASPTLLVDFLGALSSQGSQVTGTFRIPPENTNTPCVPANQDIPFTGSIDSSNLLTLTSAPFSGSVTILQLQ